MDWLIGEGRLLLDLVDSVVPDLCISHGKIELTEECRADLKDCRDMIISRACEARPVLEKPITDGRTTSYREFPLKNSLINNNIPDGVELSEIDIKAVQRIQETPFRINNQYLKAVRECLDSGLHIKKKMNKSNRDCCDISGCK